MTGAKEGRYSSQSHEKESIEGESGHSIYQLDDRSANRSHRLENKDEQLERVVVIITLGYIFANRAIVEQREPVGYLYREVPDNSQDSGWRVFTGTETREYADNPENFTIYNAETIVSFAPDITPLLGFPGPTAFERDEHGVFVEVEFDS